MILIPSASKYRQTILQAFGEKQKGYILGSRNNGKNDEDIKRILKQKILKKGK